jgi:ribosome maturation factor RimP
MMHPKELASRVEKRIVPFLDEDRIELVDLVFRSESGRWVLRIYVDKPDGIKVEDCAALSRRIEDCLDVESIIPHRYSLEVSSPGLDRILKKQSDFCRFSGMMARIEMKIPLEGRKNFKGRIGDCDGGTVELIDAEGTSFCLALADISNARLVTETSIGRNVNRAENGARKKKKKK